MKFWCCLCFTEEEQDNLNFMKEEDISENDVVPDVGAAALADHHADDNRDDDRFAMTPVQRRAEALVSWTGECSAAACSDSTVAGSVESRDLSHKRAKFYADFEERYFYTSSLKKINKPYLPLASGKLSFRNCVFIVASSVILGLGINLMIGSTALIWNFVLCTTLWTCYSANLPFLRWKKNSVLASSVMLACWTHILPVTYFLHMQTFVLKRPLVFTRSLIVTLLFLSIYTTGLALGKDIPDVEGDIKHGVDTFAARLGQKNVFWICVVLYEIAFGVAFLAGASSSSPFWMKFVTIVSSSINKMPCDANSSQVPTTGNYVIDRKSQDLES